MVAVVPFGHWPKGTTGTIPGDGGGLRGFDLKLGDP